MRHQYHRCLLAILLWSASALASAEIRIEGNVRGIWTEQSNNASSPATIAERLLPGLMDAPADMGVLQAEWRLRSKSLAATFTTQGRADASGNTRATASVNEFYGVVGDGAWQLSAGKKIVAWDVGYGFRPNDVVQQEARRALIGSTLLGRAVATADYFDANLAATLVWVNPDDAFVQDKRGNNVTEEQAFAARLYYRAGGIDLHGFAHHGAQSGASVGAALAWVATEALELHASGRYIRHHKVKQFAQNGPLLRATLPWQTKVQSDIAQILLGATWTTAGQHSFLLEAWWDGTAQSSAQWQNWSQRNASLEANIGVPPVPQRNLAYNLAWQNEVLSGSPSLQRKNLFARWSWQSGAWQPALDVLYTPDDHGYVATASIAWQGNRWHMDAGFRVYGGADASVLRQLPMSSSAYVSTNWAF